MMEIWGFLLYPMMLIILGFMWRNVRGMTIEQIVDKSAHEHHMINHIFQQHPAGGDWNEFQMWIDQHQS